MKYIAIKLDGLAFWMYFEKEKYKVENGMIEATVGWGKHGALIEKLYASCNLIKGQFQTDTLQYSY